MSTAARFGEAALALLVHLRDTATYEGHADYLDAMRPSCGGGDGYPGPALGYASTTLVGLALRRIVLHDDTDPKLRALLDDVLDAQNRLDTRAAIEGTLRECYLCRALVGNGDGLRPDGRSSDRACARCKVREATERLRWERVDRADAELRAREYGAERSAPEGS